MRSQMIGRPRFSCAVPLVASLLWGCATWTESSGSPAAVVEREAPRSIRLTLVDGSTAVMERPVVRGDSVAGVLNECVWVEGTDTRACGRAPATLPLDRIGLLEVRAFSMAHTIAVVSLTVGVVWFIYVQTVGRGFTVFG